MAYRAWPTGLAVDCTVSLPTLAYLKPFLPERRYASARTSYGPVTVSVTSRSSGEKVERIGLVFSMGASFHLLPTVL